MAETTFARGVPALDAVLGGLLAGDNVVWAGERDATYQALEQAVLAHAAQHHPTVVVATTRAEACPWRR